MKITILHIVEWTILACFVSHSNGVPYKKKCPEGEVRILGECRRNLFGNQRSSGFLRAPEFLYLGSIVNDPSHPNNANNYFVSTEAINWIVAEQNCVKWFGPGSGLVSIETEEENNDVNELLDKHNLAGTYWTGGMNDEAKGNYLWSTTKTQINGTGWTYNPWGYGEPTFSPTSKTRTILYHRNQNHWEWSTAECTAHLKYICERSKEDNSQGKKKKD